ncbi:hypothetical protein ACSBR2_023105 [Camellia fascicularis]
MATVAAEMMLRCIFDGSLSTHDLEIERRPYHRNYTCAMHKSKGACSTACFEHTSISFPKKELWNECSLSMSASKFSSQSSFLSDSSFRTSEDTDHEALSR